MVPTRAVVLLAAGCAAALGCSIVEPLDDYPGPPIATLPTHCGVSQDCSDHNACNGEEVCTDAGTCDYGTPPTIDDGNSCTIDSCDPSTGVKHVSIDIPTSVQCSPYGCPAGYYRTASRCALACGACGDCFNSFTCEQPCTSQVTACCVTADQCASSCPQGYRPQSQVETPVCGCRVDAGADAGELGGAAVVCTL